MFPKLFLLQFFFKPDAPDSCKRGKIVEELLKYFPEKHAQNTSLINSQFFPSSLTIFPHCRVRAVYPRKQRFYK
jgi:hypothetical protein